MQPDNPFAGVPAPLRAAMTNRGFEELTKIQHAVLNDELQTRNLRIASQTGSGKTIAIGIVLAKQLIGYREVAPKEAQKPEVAQSTQSLATPAAPAPPLDPLPESVTGCTHDKTGELPEVVAQAAVNSKLPDRTERHGPQALVIAPTRELAIQIRDELTWLYADVKALTIEVVTGGAPIVRERRALQRKPRLVVATPGRLLDHIRSKNINCENVQQVVLDEADQMLDMGFKDDLDAIMGSLPQERQSHLISATFPREVRTLADRFQSQNAILLEGTRLGAPNDDIEHIAHLVRPRDAYAALVNLMLLVQGERCLVFVRKRIEATELAEQLASDGFSALPFSGDLPQAQRLRTLAAFRNGIVNTLIATDVAARGIDVPDISTVVHVEPPSTPATYVHRSGRTGRAGKKGRSLLIVPFMAERRVQRLLHDAKIQVSWQPVPGASRVNKALRKRTRKNLHDALESTEFSDSEASYAETLLERHDPKTLVATLLRLAEPPLPRQPMEVSVPEPRRGDDELHERGPSRWRERRSTGPKRPFRRLESNNQRRAPRKRPSSS